MTLKDIENARVRIREAIIYSPCTHSVTLSEATGSTVFCKMDNLQRTGSFKERGACNALMLLSDSRRRKGVIAASAGNHALGLAYHGKLLGIPVSVVMPRFAPFVKIKNCRDLGARVILHGEGFQEARRYAQKLEEEEGLTYINGYDDLNIMAGQGTMALEILEQVSDLDAVVIPIGGGGLLAGMGTVFRALKPDLRIIGVESCNVPSWSGALEHGLPVEVPVQSTLADGLSVQTVGENSFRIGRNFTDEMLRMPEDLIAIAILRFMELEKNIVEGAAATTLAVLLSEKMPDLKGKRICLPLCGGNIDLNIIHRVIEKGLVADGRLCRFSASISDRPGGLARFASVISDCDAAIKDIIHDRAFSGPDIASVRVLCVVETKDHDHGEALIKKLISEGFPIQRNREFHPSAH